LIRTIKQLYLNKAVETKGILINGVKFTNIPNKRAGVN
jgi:hypothetical protein